MTVLEYNLGLILFTYVFWVLLFSYIAISQPDWTTEERVRMAALSLIWPYLIFKGLKK